LHSVSSDRQFKKEDERLWNRRITEKDPKQERDSQNQTSHQESRPESRPEFTPFSGPLSGPALDPDVECKVSSNSIVPVQSPSLIDTSRPNIAKNGQEPAKVPPLMLNLLSA